MRGQRGQATVELLGVLPALLVAGLVAWQIVLVGHATWLAADAARAAARANLVGHDPTAAAKSVLPEHLERGAEVGERDGVARVRVPVPITSRAWSRGPMITASASLEAKR